MLVIFASATGLPLCAFFSTPLAAIASTTFMPAADTVPNTV